MQQQQHQQIAHTESTTAKSSTNTAPVSTKPNDALANTAPIKDPTKETDIEKKENITAHTVTNVPTVSSASIVNNTSHTEVIVTYHDLKTTFDVFLQVLLSQYLNGEFLMRIKQIQDEYFKPSIDFIESIFNEKIDVCQNYLSAFISYLSTSLNANSNNTSQIKLNDTLFNKCLVDKPELILVISNAENSANIKCESFVYTNYQDHLNAELDKLLMASCIIKFAGRSYNADTLETLNDSQENVGMCLYINANKDGEFFLCSKMFNIIKTLHSLKHFKINFYQICSKKVINNALFYFFLGK